MSSNNAIVVVKEAEDHYSVWYDGCVAGDILSRNAKAYGSSNLMPADDHSLIVYPL